MRETRTRLSDSSVLSPDREEHESDNTEHADDVPMDDAPNSKVRQHGDRQNDNYGDRGKRYGTNPAALLLCLILRLRF